MSLSASGEKRAHGESIVNDDEEQPGHVPGFQI